jgi:starch synthase
MKVLCVASECVPFVKTGGLADVVGAFPGAFAAVGVDVRVLLPAYPAVKAALPNAKVLRRLPKFFGARAQLIAGQADGIELIALDAPHLYDRPGNPYLGPDGKDWPDNHLRFGALGRAAARLALEGYDGWRPDVVHAHDWQAGLTPAYMRFARRQTPPCLTTIHNIAFQGMFPPETMASLALPKRHFQPEGFECFGKVGFLKAGLFYSDRITTVSPTYARELSRPEFGMGLEGLIAHRRADVSGILNGIDLNIWNPGTDPHIAANYSARNPARKAKNRQALAAHFGLRPDPGAPLFCVVSRLTTQKRLDLLLEALPRLLARGACLAVLGTGEADLETAFTGAARDNPGKVGVIIGYDEPLSHLMQAGSDAIIVPSRFEPCGLTQLYGLRYGTLPVVACTGGLADTVIDANDAALVAGVATGFQFSPIEGAPLADAIDRSCDAFAQKNLWSAMMRRAMRHPVGWETSAAAYAKIYADLVEAEK